MTNADVSGINLGATLYKSWIWEETLHSTFVSLTACMRVDVLKALLLVLLQYACAGSFRKLLRLRVRLWYNSGCVCGCRFQKNFARHEMPLK